MGRERHTSRHRGTKITKKRELLKGLERRGEINAAPETSLSVSEADKMLSRLAKDGHLQVRVREGILTYAM